MKKNENKKSIEKSKKKPKGTSKRLGALFIVTMFVSATLVLGGVITILIYNIFVFNGHTQDMPVIDGGGIDITVTPEEGAIIDVVQKSRDSVVSIAVSQLTFSPEQGLIDESSNIGTGFIVDKGGIIVTNQHVVSNTSAEYRVITREGEEYNVIDIQRDDNNDIAIIRVDAEDLEPLILGDSDALVVGQTVIAIGTPFGRYVGSVTTGIISGLDRSVTASTGWFGSSAKTYENVIQTDTAINPGNSGGPLLNTVGEVIGVNFATTSGADNISFALPINIVRDRIEEYRTYGRFIRPYLGVTYQMISERQALYYDNVVAGALIVRVDPYGPARAAGIERGDIIIEFGEHKIDRSLGSIISSYGVGEEIEIKLWNNGEERIVIATLDELD